MARTEQTKWTDEDDDHLVNLQECLSSDVWLRVRGTTKGDFQGETLADTFRRELSWLKSKEESR
jgi:hypothetical protein